MSYLQVQTRAAKPEDIAALNEVARAAKRSWGYSEELMNLWSESLTITLDAIQQQKVTVACQEGRIVAFYAMRPRSSRQAELTHLWVLPHCQRRGVGRQLLGHALESRQVVWGHVPAD